MLATLRALASHAEHFDHCTNVMQRPSMQSMASAMGSRTGCPYKAHVGPDGQPHAGDWMEQIAAAARKA
jgi:hypothetical protein